MIIYKLSCFRIFSVTSSFTSVKDESFVSDMYNNLHAHKYLYLVTLSGVYGLTLAIVGIFDFTKNTGTNSINPPIATHY
jgi:hypothetical protein